MLIPLRFGFDFHGQLHQPGGRVLATRTFHLFSLPLIPLGTYELSAGAAKPAPFSFKSLFAAFFKPWGFLGACALAAWSLSSSWRQHPEGLWLLIAAAALFFPVYLSWLFLGHRLQRGSARLVVVPFIALATFGFLTVELISGLRERAHGLDARRLEGFFRGAPPKADMQISLAALQKLAGEDSARFTKVSSDTKLAVGDLVELEVPGGFSTGVVARASDDEWVDVVTRANNQRYTVSRRVLTLLK